MHDRMQDRKVTIDGRTILRKTVEDRSLQLASALASLGVKEGDVIAVFLRNRQPYLEVILACRRLGIYYCPINWHFTASEVQYIIEDSDARLIITERDLLAIAAQANALKRPIACQDLMSDLGNPLSDVKLQDYDEWISEFPAYVGPVVSPRGHMAYTSGTTGRPKGVVREPIPLEHIKENQAVVARIVAKTYGLTPGVRALLPAPIYHSAPSSFCQMSLLMCDHLVVTDRFDPEELLRNIEAFRIEVVYMVPIMYVRLLRLDASIRRRYDVSSLRFVASTGSPCPPDIKRQMIDWFGPVIHETYASSEAGLITLATPEDALARPGTAGKPLETATVRILGPDFESLPPGEVGHIYVRNTAYADFTYRNRPDARKAIERDGLISLGDIGYLDHDGYLFVCDRETDMVLSGGVNVYPAEIEHIMVGFPGVADCAVVGLPDKEYGQRLVGVIEPRANAEISVQELNQWLSQHLARFKIPKSYRFLSSLPRDPNGKISRSKLRQQILSGDPAFLACPTVAPK